jgi:hypothetical protein
MNTYTSKFGTTVVLSQVISFNKPTERFHTTRRWGVYDSKPIGKYFTVKTTGPDIDLPEDDYETFKNTLISLGTK